MIFVFNVLLVDYLGDYTRRVAIPNCRITQYDGDKVIFKYKDYNVGITNQTMTLPVQDTYVGLCSMCCLVGFTKPVIMESLLLQIQYQKLGLAFILLDHEQHIPSLEGLTAFEVYEKITDTDPWLYPNARKVGWSHKFVKTKGGGIRQYISLRSLTTNTH